MCRLIFDKGVYGATSGTMRRASAIFPGFSPMFYRLISDNEGACRDLFKSLLIQTLFEN